MHEDNIMELFAKVSMILHRLQYHGGREQTAFSDPHRGQGRVMQILKMQPEISQKDLSYLLDMSNQSLSELLGKLEKAGFVQRTKSEKDRRVMNVSLTEAGAVAAKQSEENKRDNDGFFDCLSEAERRNLTEYLNKIITAYEFQVGPDFSAGWDRRHDGISPEMMHLFKESGFLKGTRPRRGGFGRNRHGDE